MSKMNTNCRFYKGHIPCVHHKREGVHCPECNHYEALQERIIIIKLGATGDVIRTTPLLRKIKDAYPRAEITWLTYSPDVVPKGWVDNVLEFNLSNITWLKQQAFFWLINLDKDKEAIALAERITAKKKSGFRMDEFGKCLPMGQAAEEHKWLTGIWDDLNITNTKNYMQEIFSICGFEFSNEEYILELKDCERNIDLDKGKITVGLNTGCGARWPTRLWPDSYWSELAKSLIEKGYNTILLGGPEEDIRNRNIAAETEAQYFGTKPFLTFFSLINQCDIVVSQVTMAMHAAIALKKHLVLINNIFNKNEFFLYNRGVIIQPELDCLGCFKQTFDNNCKSRNCMELVSVSNILDAIDTASVRLN